VGFCFFGGIGVKVSCVDMGFVGGLVRVRGESIEKFLKIAFSRENIYTGKVECIVTVAERGRQRTSDRLVQGHYYRGHSPLYLGMCSYHPCSYLLLRSMNAL